MISVDRYNINFTTNKKKPEICTFAVWGFSENLFSNLYYSHETFRNIFILLVKYILTDSISNIRHYFAAVQTGRITRLARPSVRPSVCRTSVCSSARKAKKA